MGQTWVCLKGPTCSAGGGITAWGVARHPYAALKPPGKGPAAPVLSWAFGLLFAGVLRKSTITIATASSVARAASRGSCEGWVPSTRGAGLGTLITTKALPALTPPTTTPSLANWPDQPEGMHSTSTFSAFDCRCGEGLGAHRELRCKFSLFMPFMHQIPVLMLLQSFPVWLSWARRGNCY